MAQALVKGSRITGTQRTELAAELAQRYAGGESIRAIAEGTGRSFGFVHGLIKESGVEVRGRGGATRGAAAAAAASDGSSTTVAPEAEAARISKAKVTATKPDKKTKVKKSDKNDEAKKSKKGKKR